MVAAMATHAPSETEEELAEQVDTQTDSPGFLGYWLNA